jgi:hypothetical protein
VKRKGQGGKTVARFKLQVVKLKIQDSGIKDLKVCVTHWQLINLFKVITKNFLVA